MNEPTVYVVMGSTGEYSDSREWAVAAYLDESEAQQHVTKLDEWLRVRKWHMDDNPTGISYDEGRKVRDGSLNPLDVGFDVDYTGTRYYVMPVRLLAAAPSADAVDPHAEVLESGPRA